MEPFFISGQSKAIVSVGPWLYYVAALHTKDKGTGALWSNLMV